METVTPQKKLTIADIIHFISSYRKFEKAPLKEGYTLIKKLFPEHLHDHICSHWRNKERCFSSFFLNLSHRNMLLFLHEWGIKSEEDNKYIKERDTDPMNTVFLKPPSVVNTLRLIVLFFNNHGIADIYERDENDKSIIAIKLSRLPRSDKRFGNSKNWGDYILSLPAPEQADLLKKIIAYQLKHER
jgi:hypothetical protein